MAHQCHATDCTKEIKPELLMCFPHWQKVPRELQLRIWRNYRKGQCQDYQPSIGYLHAARDAVMEVAKQENRVPDTKLYDLMLGIRGEPTFG